MSGLGFESLLYCPDGADYLMYHVLFLLFPCMAPTLICGFPKCSSLSWAGKLQLWLSNVLQSRGICKLHVTNVPEVVLTNKVLAPWQGQPPG